MSLDNSTLQPKLDLEKKKQPSSPCCKRCWVVMLMIFLLLFVAILGAVIMLLHSNKLEEVFTGDAFSDQEDQRNCTAKPESCLLETALI